MQEVTMNLDEVGMVLFLKDMLSMDKSGTWQRRTTETKLNINFKGDNRTVQKIIYEWLDIPERKQHFNF